ncbi:MAG: ABC transporter permease [Planctomycetota bacterium]|nr:ABC transporter permease [Planctomycetota bacterium]
MAVPLAYSYRSVAVRKGSSAMAVFGIALVVVVFVVLLALAEGFRRAVATSGSPRNLIILRKGADAEMQSQVRREAARIIEELPVVATGGSGEKVFSLECLTLINLPRADGSGDSYINLRGASPTSLDVHEGVRLREGRWFRWGTNEVVVGAALARRLDNFKIGHEFVSGRHLFEIVGIFESDGNSFESEIWMDANIFISTFNRGDVYQSAIFRASGSPAEALESLKKILDDDPRLQSVMVQNEKAYYKKQSELMASVITILGGILTFIMAIGGIVGAMNTMYAAVAQRKREIGCMLSMGFTPESIWIAFIVESLCLASVGAMIGCVLSLVFNGIKTGTTNWATFSETAFEFRVLGGVSGLAEFPGGILVVSSILALSMGFIGGFLPALQASRLKVVEALRRA